ncbi:MAG: Phenylalanine--tRNA ligase alpha subunit [Chlamydiia bacterium]|nr:Phenylalanine--tRNA ligase alpha subunit [Chlamydiia bacterium]MCH9618021.1 Phenylalanine--tRNA ligase alpha subunit [Chlamydiia bacterium]MCH9623654.1 Phenylalanine--tRNA ligase alpha subunit [Chlamydiia bacterium]
MENKIAELKNTFDEEVKGTNTVRDIDEMKVKYLGKKGPVQDLMQSLKDCSKEQRPLFGKLINDLKGAFSEKIENRFSFLKDQELKQKLAREKVDISLPGKKEFKGSIHPISQMMDKVVDVLKGMGFSVFLTPEVESDYYNYGGLNYPEDHPARDMQDTYYLDKSTLLRSHTTSFQQHVFEMYDPPVRMVCPGKCFRNETISSRSHVIFHQCDVMYVDKDVTFADLISTQKEFYRLLFGREVEIRMRPSYFPFVEPGMEVDLRCLLCDGAGCKLCKHSGWLEVCGAGMIHPEIIKGGGLDPEVYSGFAWGGGIERLYLLMHQIDDIRLFMENDTRFLQQFP